MYLFPYVLSVWCLRFLHAEDTVGNFKEVERLGLLDGNNQSVIKRSCVVRTHTHIYNYVYSIYMYTMEYYSAIRKTKKSYHLQHG